MTLGPFETIGSMLKGATLGPFEVIDGAHWRVTLGPFETVGRNYRDNAVLHVQILTQKIGK
jgi:hypothetical protein